MEINDEIEDSEEDGEFDSAYIEPEPTVDHPALQPERPILVAHAEPGPDGTGLDGNTPFEVGIQGRNTRAGGMSESERKARDWQVHVDVDQPVQKELG